MRSNEREPEHERRVRQTNELLQELRVSLPGVQVLFAFLLAVPFNQRFAQVNSFEQAVYFFALICAALSATCLIAPTAQHRLLWRQQERERRLEIANKLAIVGTVFLALSIAAVLFLITDFLFGTLPAAVVVTPFCLFVGWIWYGLPLLRRFKN